MTTTTEKNRNNNKKTTTTETIALATIASEIMVSIRKIGKTASRIRITRTTRETAKSTKHH